MHEKHTTLSTYIHATYDSLDSICLTGKAGLLLQTLGRTRALRAHARNVCLYYGHGHIRTLFCNMGMAVCTSIFEHCCRICNLPLASLRQVRRHLACIYTNEKRQVRVGFRIVMARHMLNVHKRAAPRGPRPGLDLCADAPRPREFLRVAILMRTWLSCDRRSSLPQQLAVCGTFTFRNPLAISIRAAVVAPACVTRTNLT